MHIALWVFQVLLALSFGMGGAMTTFTPLDQLAEQMAWVTSVPAWVPRLAGITEMVAAVGLILPAATKIKPQLTGWAGVVLVVVGVLATGFHVMRAEYTMAMIPMMHGAAAAFVAYGRLKLSPIAERSSGGGGSAEY